MDTKKKVCALCGKEFSGGGNNRKYCSAECARIVSINAKREKRKKAKMPMAALSLTSGSIDKKNEQARAMGLTYGQYQGRIWASQHPVVI